ncbi:hypothetical protein [Cupriavidus pauculus]|uniref:hypothetical protein n=1 Tax=Cupriavidus pauculus TaxID=82633 RepID=UPI001CBCD24E|nr:hypothetical protein [Cupriavidus pauculus]
MSIVHFSPISESAAAIEQSANCAMGVDGAVVGAEVVGAEAVGAEVVGDSVVMRFSIAG